MNDKDSSFSPLKISKTYFKQIEEISKTTRILLQKDTEEKYVIKTFLKIKETISKEQFASFCIELTKLNYPFYLPLSYFNLGDKDNDYPSIFTPYMQNRSLKYVINQQLQKNPPEGYDDYHKFLLLYQISKFLEEIHKDRNFHGNPKLSNVLLDENFTPLITDLFLYDIIDKPSPEELKNKPIDFLVSLPPEIFKEGHHLTSASDIYSFGIIILQVLTGKINVLNSEDSDQKISIPDSIPFHLHEALVCCFSEKQEELKTATEMKNILERIMREKFKKIESPKFQRIKDDNSDIK